MSNKIDLIMSSVQQFCREGYLLPKERETLFALAELHGIDKAELENVLNRELEKVRAGRLGNLYKAAKQPDAALSDKPVMFQQSRRQFPDMLRLGTMKLKLNPKVTAPAFVPLKDMAGLCVIHNDQPEIACNILQNVAMRLLLSLPRSLALVTVVDPASMGADYIGLSGVDGHLLRVIVDEKQVQPFLRDICRESASFNFNELGNTFADIAEYNRTNRSKAHPYQIIILSDYPSLMDENILPEIKKIVKLAQKTGVFFLFAVGQQSLKNLPEMLDVFKLRQEEHPSLCVIDTIKKELIAEQSDEVEFFNNAFDFDIDEDLMFTSDTILHLNHEFDPINYPLGISDDDRGDFCLESLNVVAGKYPNRDKTFTVSLQQRHDNVISVSNNAQALEAMAVGMLKSMALGYKRSELDYVFYNCGFIPESLIAANVVANIHADKLQYLQTLLKHIASLVALRKNLFADAGVTSYEAYRDTTEMSLPRVVCLLWGIDSVLESENMSAIEAVMLLDQLLDEAGQFGIHFLLFGKASINLFKLNLAECVRFKLFSMLNEEEAMLIGVFSTAEELNHQSQPNGSLLYDTNQAVSVKLEHTTVDANELKETLKAFVTEKGPISRPKAFVDVDDNYPQVYKSVNAGNIAEESLKDSIPIGFLRGFATQFATLGSGNVMIVGDEADGVQSILRSVHATLKRTGRLNAMSVYSASGSYPLGLPGLPGVNVYSDIHALPVAENGVVCLLHAETFNPAINNTVYELMDRARQNHAQVLLFAKDDSIANVLGLAAADFTVKLALCHAPEGFISLMLFYSNNELSMPTVPLQAVCEKNTASGSMEINAMWLFNY
jgi:hypothetical protein